MKSTSEPKRCPICRQEVDGARKCSSCRIQICTYWDETDEFLIHYLCGCYGIYSRQKWKRFSHNTICYNKLSEESRTWLMKYAHELILPGPNFDINCHQLHFSTSRRIGEVMTLASKDNYQDVVDWLSKCFVSVIQTQSKNSHEYDECLTAIGVDDNFLPISQLEAFVLEACKRNYIDVVKTVFTDHAVDDLSMTNLFTACIVSHPYKDELPKYFVSLIDPERSAVLNKSLTCRLILECMDKNLSPQNTQRWLEWVQDTFPSEQLPNDDDNIQVVHEIIDRLIEENYSTLLKRLLDAFPNLPVKAHHIHEAGRRGHLDCLKVLHTKKMYDPNDDLMDIYINALHYGRQKIVKWFTSTVKEGLSLETRMYHELQSGKLVFNGTIKITNKVQDNLEDFLKLLHHYDKPNSLERALVVNMIYSRCLTEK